ncbi:hypothetical protein U0070_024804 [Myodes glareolus]|uniref:Uncharacterized protein n=1 Tax=Myodes glareolus TaxID=447135 RepID=A0AAW0INS4_MYOGA
MATEFDLLRDQSDNLNHIFRQYQIEHIFQDPNMQPLNLRDTMFTRTFSSNSKQPCIVNERNTSMSKDGRSDVLVSSIDDQSCLPPLIAEYEKRLEELNRQLTYYQV